MAVERRQKLRGTTAQLNVTSGLEGLLAVDLSNKSLRLYDGVLIGGYRFPNKTENDTLYPPKALSLTAGAGLTGGGDLTANREFAIGQGDGITVAADTIAVDATVVRTTGPQTIGGFKTYTSNAAIRTGGGAVAALYIGNQEALTSFPRVNFNSSGNPVDFDSRIYGSSGSATQGQGILFYNAAGGHNFDGVINGNGSGLTALNGTNITAGTVADARIASTLARTSRAVNTGDGLSGGGNLTVDRTLTVDATVVRTTRNIASGDGLSGGGTLAADRTLSVDATVVRTTGDQTIAGTKTFSSNVAVGGRVSVGNGSAAAPTLTFGTDLNTGIYSEAADVIRFTTAGVLRGSITTVGFDGNGSLLDNLNGSAITTGTVADARIASTIARTNIVVTAGNGLTGGGDLAGGLTLTLGNPGSITQTSGNTVTATSHTHALSAADVAGLYADIATGSIGSYGMFTWPSTTINRAPGETVAGSILAYSNANGEANSSPVGTWRLMGRITPTNNSSKTSLFMRIA